MNKDYLSTFTPDPISLTMGWIVGRRIAGQRGKYVEPDVPDVPSGVYDDTFPIEWNTMDVVENPGFTVDGVPFVKVSNLTPTLEEMNTVNIGAYENGTALADPTYPTGSTSFDIGFVVEYTSNYPVAVVTKVGTSADIGVTAPETGIYVLNVGFYGISYDLKMEVPTYVAVWSMNVQDVLDEGSTDEVSIIYETESEYNGVRCPGLPDSVLDDSERPYRIILDASKIRAWNDRTYLLWTSANPFYFNADGYITTTYSSSIKLYTTNATGAGEFSYYDILSVESYNITSDALIWANHDVKLADSTVYLAASEPVFISKTPYMINAAISTNRAYSIDELTGSKFKIELDGEVYELFGTVDDQSSDSYTLIFAMYGDSITLWSFDTGDEASRGTIMFNMPADRNYTHTLYLRESNVIEANTSTIQ